MSKTIDTVHATAVYEHPSTVLVECTWSDADGEIFVDSYEFAIADERTVDSEISIDTEHRPLVTDALDEAGYEFA